MKNGFKPIIVPFKGGLDLITPAALVEPGFAIGGDNYEVESRGYRRMEGYERFDGRFKPSEAEYLILNFLSGNLAITAGTPVTGQTSGATAIALVDGVVTSGSYGASNAAGYLVLYNVTGTFQNAENIRVSGVTRCVANGTGTVNSATPDATHDSYIASVTANRRAAIVDPTGAGAIRGVTTYKGDVYCFRDNAGATAGQMFKATTAGWVLQSFGHTLDFKDGLRTFTEGDTVRGAVSGATGIVKRVILQAGAWSGDGSGFLVLASVTGTFNASEIITSDEGWARSNGVNAAITLPVAGTYECIVANFYATEAGERLYFTTRTGRAFEWDGTTLSPVRTGLSDALDKPQHIAFHHGHLFLSFDGGSLQHSSIGEPLEWSAITGAGEIGFGQDITGLKSDTRDSMIVGGVSKIGYLTGRSAATFDLQSISESSGVIENTLEVMGSGLFMDDAGLRDLAASQVYGNWNIGTLTQLVEPLLLSKKAAGVTPVGQVRVRSKSQYRLFFSDTTGLFVYLGRKKPEIMSFALDHQFVCFHSGRDSTGQEVLFAGGSNGRVYQLDAGTSFDGAVIRSFVRLSWLNQGNSMANKRYHRARLEGQPASTDTVLQIAADFTYASAEVPTMSEVSETMAGSGGFWETATWNEFQWSSQIESQIWFELETVAENCAMVFSSESAVETPHVLSTLAINWSPRRALR